MYRTSLRSALPRFPSLPAGRCGPGGGHCKLRVDAASSRAREPHVIRITWYGHACFRLETRGAALVPDPYTPALAGLEPVPEAAGAGGRGPRPAGARWG